MRRSIAVPSLLLVVAAGLALAQPGGGRPGSGGGDGGGGRPGLVPGAQPGGPGGQPGGPGGQPGFNPEQFIDRIMQNDANGDGKLSRDETPPQLAQRFDNLDANRDGFLDRSELMTAANAFSGGGRGGGRIPLGRAMENIENALHALQDSAMTASTLASDLEQVQAMQEGFLAAKFQSATMRLEPAVLEHFEGSEGDARMELREHLIEGLVLALELETALMDADPDSARELLDALEELEHQSHEEFRVD